VAIVVFGGFGFVTDKRLGVNDPVRQILVLINAAIGNRHRYALAGETVFDRHQCAGRRQCDIHRPPYGPVPGDVSHIRVGGERGGGRAVELNTERPDMFEEVLDLGALALQSGLCRSPTANRYRTRTGTLPLAPLRSGEIWPALVSVANSMRAVRARNKTAVITSGWSTAAAICRILDFQSVT